MHLQPCFMLPLPTLQQPQACPLTCRDREGGIIAARAGAEAEGAGGQGHPGPAQGRAQGHCRQKPPSRVRWLSSQGCCSRDSQPPVFADIMFLQNHSVPAAVSAWQRSCPHHMDLVQGLSVPWQGVAGVSDEQAGGGGGKAEGGQGGPPGGRARARHDRGAAQDEGAVSR